MSEDSNPDYAMKPRERVDPMFVDQNKHNRVMWLMNHTALRAFEVPLLRSMGYEVFVPKSYPYDEGNLSASIDYATDATLSIPTRELEFLNRQDFYTYLSPEAARVANAYFGYAIIGFFPRQLDSLVRDFKGTIIMRPFGLANGVTYTDVTAQSLGQGFFSRAEKIQDRFWFGLAYDNLAEVEKGVFRRKAITLPLGLAASNKAPWTGTLAKVLFVCPRIKTTTYFGNIYREFKSQFGDLPHMIGGAQPIAVEDPNVLGFLPREKYDELFRDARVMFYHSRERHHLHYHPLEAIQSGMPLVFMAGGMLDHLGGEGLPGRARTIKEAHEKLRRVLRGDRHLTEAIRSSQIKLLDSFSWDRCRHIWSRNFAAITSAVHNAASDARIEVRQRPKIAMILTEAYRGGTLEVVKLATKMLKKGSAERGEPCDVAFYHLPSALYSDRDFADLKDQGIPSREFDWKVIDWSTAHRALSLGGWHGPMPQGAKFAVPDEGADNFKSFDHWLFLTDRFPERILPLRPYSVYVHDFLQRYIPSLFGPHYEWWIIDSLRGAEQVLCSTDHTVVDATQYAGVHADRVRLVPLVAELADDNLVAADNRKSVTSNYFLWPTNVQFHKNHMRAIEALSEYYSSSNRRIKCVITGVNTTWLDPDTDTPDTKWDYALRTREAFAKSKLVGKHVDILGDLPRLRYFALLRDARFVFHPTLTDNGTLVAVEAASVGVPLVSHDYPPMRYYERRFGIPMKFIDARDVQHLASALIEMETEADELRKRMPSREALGQFNWRNQASAFWASVRTGIA
jgi:glycosyltransferase involved in cell wall biosynthesis